MQHAETSFQTFLGKEWLVKADSATGTPYLFKFVSSTVDLTCCVLFTDTKSVWVEELTSHRLARRWRECNLHASPFLSSAEEEDEWRTSILKLLAKAHTLGGISNLSFEVVNTNYSDIAFALECDFFKWKWETSFVGHKTSADTISRHLIFPLIGANHLLFSSSEPVQAMTDADIEKAVDKIGRTARRAVDTHVKNALSKPRISTILRRVTAMFNFLSELPDIKSTPETPDLQVPLAGSKYVSDLNVEMKEASQSKSLSRTSHSPRLPKPPVQVDSATDTESSAGDEASSRPIDSKAPSTGQKPTPERLAPPESSAKHSVSPAQSSTAGSSLATSRPKTPEPAATDTTSDDDSSPIRPPQKKAKPTQAPSSESDSESERKARVVQLKSGSGSGSGGARKGVRQPIKRGGKRF